MSYPLEDLKVLDMARVLSGPFAGRMLCDLGADVVKVEPPDGDITRIWGAQLHGQSGFFTQQNAGKRCLSVDLARVEGQRLVQALAAAADILLENFRPGVMKRLGLDWESLHERNPRLIMCSITGFGQDSPDAERAAYAPIIHAESGLIARHAKHSGHPPADLALSIADTNASLHALVGLLSAVIMRQRTGIGQHVDVAMLDAMLATDDYQHYSLDGVEDLWPLGSDVWETHLGPILIAGDFRHVWRRLVADCKVQDPTPPTASLLEKIHLRRKTAREFFAAFQDGKELIGALDRMNLAWGYVRSSKEVPQQPSVQARHSIVQVDDRGGGTRPVVQSPYRFSDATSGIRGVAPYRGEHNAEVLAEWLALDSGDALVLEERGILQRDIRRTRKPLAPAVRISGMAPGLGEGQESDPLDRGEDGAQANATRAEVEVNLSVKLD